MSMYYYDKELILALLVMRRFLPIKNVLLSCRYTLLPGAMIETIVIFRYAGIVFYMIRFFKRSLSILHFLDYPLFMGDMSYI